MISFAMHAQSPAGHVYAPDSGLTSVIADPSAHVAGHAAAAVPGTWHGWSHGSNSYGRHERSLPGSIPPYGTPRVTISFIASATSPPSHPFPASA